MRPFLLIFLSTRAAAQVCSSIPTFDHNLTPTRTLHISPTGSNSTGNGSPQSPYATLSFAAAQATPGTAIILHPGAYSGGTFLTNLAGTATAPIWIGGDPSLFPGQPRPLIQGASEALHLIKPRYIVLHDLEVSGSSANGINVHDGGDYANENAARFLTFRNLSIHDIGGTGNQDGLKLSGVNDFTVLNCTIARCGGAGSGSGIDHVGCHRGLIARCTFTDLSGNAVQAKGGSEDLEVRWCTMTEAGQRAVNLGGSTGFEFFRPPLSTTDPNFEARDIRIIANLIIGSQSPIAYVGCIDCLVAHNTIITPHNWIIRILQETTTTPPYTFIPCSGGRFESNLVYFDRSDLSTYVNIGPSTSPSTFSFANNPWYAYDNPAASNPTLPVPQTGAVIGQNPLFFNPPAANYALQSASPARSAALSPAPIPGDLHGLCYRTPPSIGAFEVCPANCDGNSAPPLLTANDFQCFLNAFAAQSLNANCDGSTSAPTLTANDFQCFINAYAAGCP